MNAVELMANLAAHGVRLSVDGDDLLVEARRGVLTNVDRGDLARLKPQTMALLPGGKPEDRARRDPRSWLRLLPRCSVSWRERWGRRANELSAAGVPWPEDERLAFEEILRESESG